MYFLDNILLTVVGSYCGTCVAIFFFVLILWYYFPLGFVLFCNEQIILIKRFVLLSQLLDVYKIIQPLNAGKKLFPRHIKYLN